MKKFTKKARTLATVMVAMYALFLAVGIASVRVAYAAEEETGLAAEAPAEEILDVQAEPCEHSFDWTVAVEEPTCSSYGKADCHCELCGEIIEMDIPMKAHAEPEFTWLDSGDGYATLNCPDCGAIMYAVNYDPTFKGISTGERGTIGGWHQCGTLCIVKDRVYLPVIEADCFEATGVGAVLAPAFDNVLFMPYIVNGAGPLPFGDYGWIISMISTEGEVDFYESELAEVIEVDSIGEWAEGHDIVLLFPQEDDMGTAVAFKAVDDFLW